VPQPRFISFKFKIAAAMVLAVILVSLGSLALVRGQVTKHFEEALEAQYAKQFQLFQEREAERLDAVAGEILNSTSNPRLFAALMEEDFSRFYYDLAEELESFHQNMEQQYGSAELWPFFRFIRHDGTYLAPESATRESPEDAVDGLPGILSPLSEARTRELVEDLRTPAEASTVPRSGFLSAAVGGEPRLFEAFVCPVTDAFGFFMGDLVVVIPWRNPEKSGAAVRSAVIVEGRVFGGGDDGDGWRSRLADSAAVGGEPERVRAGGEEYLVFSRVLDLPGRFPEAAQATLFSLREQKELLATITRILFLLALAGIVFSLVPSMLLANRLHAPILRLKHAASRVGLGDFDARVEVRGHDEIAQLSRAFNEMTEGLSLKERYKAVLSKVADPKVAERLMEGKIDMKGESVTASVLFCDIRGFTDMSEGMDPRRLISILNAHMTAMTEVVYAHGGVVDKFVGDELMVLFGVPVEVEDPKRQAFDCAAAMIDRCREMNAHREPSIEIGIGVAHGVMVAGCMGSEDRLNYTVLGERVNLAARLCAQASPMEIVVDEPIGDALGDEYALSERKTLPLRGFKTAPPFYVVQPPRHSPPQKQNV